MFSTTTVCPSERRRRSAVMRASVSVGPPAENATTSDNGLVGQACAPAPGAPSAAPGAGSDKAKQQIDNAIRTIRQQAANIFTCFPHSPKNRRRLCLGIHYAPVEQA